MVVKRTKGNLNNKTKSNVAKIKKEKDVMGIRWSRRIRHLSPDYSISRPNIPKIIIKIKKNCNSVPIQTSQLSRNHSSKYKKVRKSIQNSYSIMKELLKESKLRGKVSSKLKKKLFRKSMCQKRLTKSKIPNFIFRKSFIRKIPKMYMVSRTSSTKLNDVKKSDRKNHILNILNHGTINDIQKLHSIGRKTAKSIILFRHMKGEIKNISELLQLPVWHHSQYEQFLIQNYLKKE